MLHTVCVFCAASPGVDPVYVEQAAAMGRLLASTGRRLVYGGGRTGLMGALADAVLDVVSVPAGVIVTMS